MTRRQLVVVTALGGLGNQLFQFAAAKSLQSDPREPVVIDSRHDYAWRMSLGDVLRPDAFRYATPTELLRLRQLPRLPVLHRTMLRLQEKTRPGPGIRPLSRTWTRYRPHLSLSSYVGTSRMNDGWFATKHTFSMPSDGSRARRRRWWPQRDCLGTISSGSHSRSGPDYAGFGIRLPPNYYRRAAETFRGTSPSFVITGDVAEHCEYIGRELAATIGPVRLGCDLTPKQQLDALSLCDNLVISNSSFAWWAAWLGDHRRGSAERVVIHPTPWIDGAPTTCPDRWRSMPSSQGGAWF